MYTTTKINNFLFILDTNLRISAITPGSVFSNYTRLGMENHIMYETELRSNTHNKANA